MMRSNKSNKKRVTNKSSNKLQKSSNKLQKSSNKKRGSSNKKRGSSNKKRGSRNKKRGSRNKLNNQRGGSTKLDENWFKSKEHMSPYLVETALQSKVVMENMDGKLTGNIGLFVEYKCHDPANRQPRHYFTFCAFEGEVVFTVEITTEGGEQKIKLKNRIISNTSDRPDNLYDYLDRKGDVDKDFVTNEAKEGISVRSTGIDNLLFNFKQLLPSLQRIQLSQNALVLQQKSYVGQEDKSDSVTYFREIVQIDRFRRRVIIGVES